MLGFVLSLSAGAPKQRFCIWSYLRHCYVLIFLHISQIPFNFMLKLNISSTLFYLSISIFHISFLHLCAIFSFKEKESSDLFFKYFPADFLH